MWSAFSDPVDLYLASGTFFVQRGAGVLQQLPLGADADLEAALAAAPEAASARRWRVFLSGGLCPAVSFEVPPAVRARKELAAIAAASAEAALPPERRPAAHALEREGARVAAPLAASLLASIRAATVGRGGQLLTVAPLWSVATQCKLVRGPATAGLVLEEPDSCTLVATPARGEAGAITLPRAADGSLDTAAMRRWQTAMGLPPEQWVRLVFGARAAPLAGAPACFPERWERR